ncbi:ATP-binding protein [Psychromonas sp. B3M02]|uniref:ATP-binding protein n=1 Tax=Psychromonas sp. B3M02 TaxID=2267226 RepID=UPI00215DAAB9|nr:ATP-binding protein [Psychromonas sp. B3M02]
MKLIHKFFLAFFITNITLVGVMLVFIYINFTKDFNHFIDQQEQKHFSEVKQQLIDIYKKTKNWDAVVDNSQQWRAIVDPQEKPQNDKQAITERPTLPSLLWFELPNNLLKTGRRISLYDQQKKVLVGREDINENPLIKPILINNKAVAWLGLVPSRLSASSPAKAFLNAQLHNYLMIALLVIILAFVMAILLSKHLTKPIQQIVNATTALNEGDFDKRIPSLSLDELGTLSQNVNHLASTLQDNQQMRFQWMSDTSHELKTPLTVLRSHLIALQDGIFTADQHRISLLINQVDNLNYIVDDLSQLAHSDTAHLTYEFQTLNMAELIQQTIDSCRARFQQRQLHVAPLHLDKAHHYQVNGDPERLKQLLMNLMENSCRYTDPGGQIAISLKPVKQQLQLTISDSAPGVSKQERDKLFERFYRVEKSRSREYGGSGLGLALCQQITTAHKGEISLQDSSLGGLQVTLTLPKIGTFR